MDQDYSTKFESTRDKVSAEEWKARVDLAACSNGMRCCDCSMPRTGIPAIRRTGIEAGKK